MGSGVGLTASVMLAAAWMACLGFARRVTASGLMPALLPFCLFVSVALAVVGLLLGASPLLMLLAGALSLAVWDLLALDVALLVEYPGSDHRPPEADTTRRYERRHILTLAVALACGLLFALTSRVIAFHLPFVIVLAAVLALIVALDRAWALIERGQSFH
jgi:archaellum biogenesis protein FlaJ (TadC family)